MATLTTHARSPFWYVCFQQAGKTVRKSTGVRHNGRTDAAKCPAAVAILAAVERRQSLARFGIDGPESYEDRTIREFGEEFIASMTDRRASTRLRYSQILGTFLKWAAPAGIVSLFQVDSAVGARYFDAAKRSRGAVTVRQELSFLGAMMDNALKKRHVLFQSNPFHHKIAVPKTEERPFNRVEILTLLSMPCPHWCQVATRLSLYTGARGDSIRHLEWRHIDWDRRTIFWPKTKTDSYGSPMPDLLIEYLRPLAGTGLLINPADLGSSPAYFSATWTAHATKAGVVDAHFHRLRHTYNTALAHAGVDTATRQLLCHHKSATVNAAYTHADAALLVPAVASLSFGVQDLRSPTVLDGSQEATGDNFSSDLQPDVAIAKQGLA